MPDESAMLWTLAALAVIALAVSVCPFIPSGAWWIRVWDFPRVQLGAFCAACAVVTALTAPPWSAMLAVVLALFTLMALWQFSHAMPYTRVWRPAIRPSSEHGVSLLVTNVQVDNPRRDAVALMIQDVDPDLLVLIETDEEWLRALDRIRPRYPHREEEPLPEGRGIALWSKLPLESSTVRRVLSQKRPSVHADALLPDGRRLRLVCVHPAPPGLPRGDGERYDSRVRDAELIRIAREVERDRDHPWVVAGDFNDVAWSRTTRLFERISGLSDPRVGRGLFSTYHARYPLFRYPLDHVFVSPSISLHRIDRVRTPGSDHLAIFADLVPGPPEPDHGRHATDSEQRRASEIEAEGRRDAQKKAEAAR